MSIEAMKQALYLMRNQGDVGVDEWIAAEAALRTAIEQAEKQEPVAHIPEDVLKQLKPPMLILRNVPMYGYAAEGTVSVYTTPPAAQPAPVPKGWKLVPIKMTDEMLTAAKNQAIKTGFMTLIWEAAVEAAPEQKDGLLSTPPAAQRQWVGLTDEEHDEIIKQCAPLDSRYVAAIVESRLREKNT